jgi:hypothetical protein
MIRVLPRGLAWASRAYAVIIETHCVASETPRSAANICDAQPEITFGQKADPSLKRAVIVSWEKIAD